MSSIKSTRFVSFLNGLGYSNVTLANGVFRYEVNFSKTVNTTAKVPVEFYYLPQSSVQENLFSIQEKIWNSNELYVYVVISDNQTFVFNAKVKPRKDDLYYSQIAKFDIGAGDSLFQEKIGELEKGRLDGGYFFEWFIEKRKKKREQEVDKDLLLNLIALERDLRKLFDDRRIAHLLILRCLFLKYLEDRGIYQPGYLVNVLASNSPIKLLNAFEEVGKINGDIFKNEALSENEIPIDYLPLLSKFFQCDYLTGQHRIFPYRFDFIPIQLISHVYEAFLSHAKKQGKGIYYTPKFLVDFMLSETLVPQLELDKDLTLLDPACGSGAFLVEGYKAIVRKKKAEGDFEKKKKILQEQVFGIDNDPEALRIATFSLYLALLEGLDPNFIRQQIENKSPILPSLLNKNLVHGNTLLDDGIFKGKTFGCIVGNPPWGSVPDDDNPEHKLERAAIGNKGKAGEKEEYRAVSDYQRSQAFLLRVKKWSSDKTTFGLVINNSIFLNENAETFRKELLEQFRIRTFYELSNLNEILFRKKTIGKGDNKIEIGATEPCVIIIFDAHIDSQNVVSYVSPKLNDHSKALNLIQFGDYDTKQIKQSDLVVDDIIWRVFVNGDWEDYQLVKQRQLEGNKDISIKCSSGFQPKKNMGQIDKPYLRPIVTPSDFRTWFVKEKLGDFNWNQELRRKPEEDVFEGERFILPVRPLESGGRRLTVARIYKNEVFKHDVLCIQLFQNREKLSGLAYYLGIFNSSFIGYCLYMISVQWGKGDLKRSALRNSDIESLPLPQLGKKNMKLAQQFHVIVEEMERKKLNPFTADTSQLEKQVDDLVFDLYGLLDFEREIVKEFYEVNIHRVNDQVRVYDLEAYFNKFKKIYESVLADNLALEGTYKISPNLGAFLVFQIKERLLANHELRVSEVNDVELMHTIKKRQVEEAYYSNRLNEQKTKIYEEERFFIIKSNFFKDWTVRQAIKDANEEIQILTQESMNG